MEKQTNKAAQVVKITLLKSTIGCTKDVIATIRALGLKKIRTSSEQTVTPAIAGMIFKVKHLVKVENI